MITVSVKRILATLPPEQLCGGNVSSALGISQSNMVKLLRKDGETFARLLEDERKARCLRLIQINKNSTAALIAKHVGYRNRNNASLAFPRWFGVSLHDFKADPSLVIGV